MLKLEHRLQLADIQSKEFTEIHQFIVLSCRITYVHYSKHNRSKHPKPFVETTFQILETDQIKDQSLVQK